MVFSSTVFLFAFLPIVVGLYYIIPRTLRNLFLLLVSWFFYSWGEGAVLLIMIAITILNYGAGKWIQKTRNEPVSKTILIIAIVANLLPLIFFKYLHFIVSSLPYMSPFVIAKAAKIILPIGISFYTFHGMSYLIDIYRNRVERKVTAVDFGLYIAFFPQLVAGPIVRYSTIDHQLRERSIDLDLFYEGVIRFIKGLAKKVIIANTVGAFAEGAFNAPALSLPAYLAWLGILCYSLQIFFDFSGYSDMAIGLAKMFGFTFPENFNYPYIAQSLTDFWRRWHMSLSSWFRDYVYKPLGGNQGTTRQTCINLLIVFFITGLWHGASWNFIVWGMFHGTFIVLERLKVINVDKFPMALRHIYLLVVVASGWVFFRSPDLSYAMDYFKSMAGMSSATSYLPLISMNRYFVFILILALIYCIPFGPTVRAAIESRLPSNLGLTCRNLFFIVLLFWCIGELAQNSYNPFIYFRF